jgi:hypothetical protein
VSRDHLSIRCEPDGGGWRCTVRVGDDPVATEHEVEVTREVLQALAPDRTPEALVEASFAFLLEREPRESILRRFDLPMIGRYFPEYPADIRKRLGG